MLVKVISVIAKCKPRDLGIPEKNAPYVNHIYPIINTLKKKKKPLMKNQEKCVLDPSVPNWLCNWTDQTPMHKAL